MRRDLKKIFRAAKLVPRIGHVVENGALLVVEGRVIAGGAVDDVRRWGGAGCTEVDFGDAVIFPGFVNAHCHLDYTVFRGALLPQPSFSRWLDRVGRLKRTLSKADFVASIEKGMREAVNAGTTTICTIASFPEALHMLRPPDARVWWFYELSDLRNRLHPDDLIQGALMFFDHPQSWTGGFGLSPHAPYSTSKRLYELTRLCSAKYDMPWCTHLAESEEEFAMFEHGSGALHEFLRELGRDMSDTGGVSPLRSIFEGYASPGNCFLIHLNYLDAHDWDLLSLWGDRTRIVHCPSSHRFFGHRPFPYSRLRELGAKIAIATDSGATGGILDLRREVRLFAKEFPDVHQIDLLRMITEIPAGFLGSKNLRGNLLPGSYADFCVFSCAPQLRRESLWGYLIYEAPPPLSVHVSGERIAGV